MVTVRHIAGSMFLVAASLFMFSLENVLSLYYLSESRLFFLQLTEEAGETEQSSSLRTNSYPELLLRPELAFFMTKSSSSD